MNHLKSLTTAVLTAICLISAQTNAQSAPAEKAIAQIKRVANSPNPIVTDLSKNLFKDEQYQAPYTVQVPYQETETYTVEVPYQEDESYSVQVPYQEDESYVENVPYDVSVPYTDYETDYRSERQCNNVTRYRNDCHNEQRCYLIPGSGSSRDCRQVEECGTNVQGERICKTREVCTGQDSSPQQRCDNQQVCENIPYTEQECSDVQVPYQREVTKYRNETRYRQETRTHSVTKYRNETRTRTVTKSRTENRTRQITKYRNEDKCCVTKTRQVFDRQLQYNVSVVFPQNAQLAGSESETLNIKLVSANANGAQVQVEVLNSVFGYKVLNQNVSGSTIQIELAISPKFDLTNAGGTTIQNLKIDYLAPSQKFQVSFSDSFSSSRVQSSYAIVISDLLTGAAIENMAVVQIANGQLGGIVNAALDPQAKIKATLKVKRSGLLVAGSEINFETAVNFEKRAVLQIELTSLSDDKLVAGKFVGKGIDTAFLLTDKTPEFNDVTTTYEVLVTLKTIAGGEATLKTTTVTRDVLKQQGMSFKIADLFTTPAFAQKGLQPGREFTFTLHARRKGTDASALAGKTVRASATGRVTIL